MSQIKVTQVKSLIGTKESQRRVIRALGLRGIGNTKTHKDNNCICGMVNKVKNLVSYELVD